MARTSVKATYSLDVETVRELERMAKRWGVPKSEALRRAIHSAAGQVDERNEALEALDRLQRSINLTPAEIEAWAQESRAIRLESSDYRMRKASAAWGERQPDDPS